MRYGELRLLTWDNISFAARSMTVGASKTESGAGRTIPLNARACAILSFWAARLPERKSEHYVFPSERYGTAGDDFRPCSYATNPTIPIGRWKEAWEAAKERTQCYTACTRKLEAGESFPVVASIMDGAQAQPFAWPSAMATSESKLKGAL
jgi:integrase